METQQEKLAQELARRWKQRLAGRMPDARCRVEGGGLYWSCEAERGERACAVHCLDSAGPQYFVRFQHLGQPSAAGRTPEAAAALESVEAWLEGWPLPRLHARFAFVDRNRRALQRFEAEALALRPELAEATRGLTRLQDDFHELWLTAQDRAAVLTPSELDEAPSAVLTWDGCAMAWVQGQGVAPLADVLAAWLCERAAPSRLSERFPFAHMSEEASHYEAGRPIEGEFLVSWDAVERFYSDPHCDFGPQALRLLERLRQAGYAPRLRAGQSLWTLLLSRSRRHGLRPEQPHVAFDFWQGRLQVRARLDGVLQEQSLPSIELTPEIETLLARLADQPID